MTSTLRRKIPGPGCVMRRGRRYQAALVGLDLAALRLSGAGASAGDLAGQPVTGYAYGDDTGRRLIIYVSDEPFPVPAQAENPIGAKGAATMDLDGVVVLCSRRPHTALVLGQDEDLVRQAATTLDLI